MSAESSKQWILLAAGSKGWHNYRHQADVCHAYQMARRNGIPDEQIIVMMYDDIASNEENPFRGNIINEPNGSNVYEGVLRDYTGNDVSAKNFLAVLEGDESSVTKRGPKKVIKSGSNDTIFVYLSDHGSNGIFAFPKNQLYATDLIDTVKKMNSNQQFSQMVIYVESCHSGSLLSQLPKNINVYAVSASKPDEASQACYYDEMRNAWLADVFTACWLHHSKTVDLKKTTFQDQFAYLKRNVHSSTPCQYGNQVIYWT
ncbi:legumain-like [Megalops cyprinoides]|uniref:legumain-like n=1 Tax=Megalops cyprinoides TaxID=118141 RepID=UPI001864E0E1|nr:legumain-like [Megalops cyprinoides]